MPYDRERRRPFERNVSIKQFSNPIIRALQVSYLVMAMLLAYRLVDGFGQHPGLFLVPAGLALVSVALYWRGCAGSVVLHASLAVLWGFEAAWLMVVKVLGGNWPAVLLVAVASAMATLHAAVLVPLIHRGWPSPEVTGATPG